MKRRDEISHKDLQEWQVLIFKEEYIKNIFIIYNSLFFRYLVVFLE